LLGVGGCSNKNVNTKESLLTQYLNDITLSNKSITIIGTTPEDHALKYLIETDNTFNFKELLTLHQDNINEVKVRISQRYALLTLWYQQTNNTSWSVTSGWLVDSDECNWYGILCASNDLGGNLSIRNVVSDVILPLNGINGTISADLGLLTALTYFELSANALSGSVPESIGQWTALEYFDILDNGLDGTLPESIGQWTALTFIRVRGNALTGTLPQSIGEWSALTYFNIAFNAMNGALPESIGKWTALTAFIIFANELTGTLPESISNWSQIKIAFVYNNLFTGTMPAGICPNIQRGDFLVADCVSEITCPNTCCTGCF
jgi:hypothetical protein